MRMPKVPVKTRKIRQKAIHRSIRSISTDAVSTSANFQQTGKSNLRAGAKAETELEVAKIATRMALVNFMVRSTLDVRLMSRAHLEFKTTDVSAFTVWPLPVIDVSRFTST